MELHSHAHVDSTVAQYIETTGFIRCSMPSEAITYTLIIWHCALVRSQPQYVSVSQNYFTINNSYKSDSVRRTFLIVGRVAQSV
jgi:hypothetical protein